MVKVYIYDTTLRDGSQGEGVNFSVEDKLKIARKLDELGVDYIEGGWPGSNPKDEEFFRRARHLYLRHAKVAAFGSTRRAKIRAEEDANLRLLLEAGTPTVTLVGKSSVFQVTRILGTTLEENLAMIADSVRLFKERGLEVIYDAEHFFDGFFSDRDYALMTLKTALEAGADWVVLCDTNGGRMPWEIREATGAVLARFPGAAVGIHTHNDCELAVANSLAAVQAGATQVQGTINGYGERCGNANLCSIIPNLQLKMGIQVLPPEKLATLTEVSRYVAEVANLAHNTHQPFVGASAFAHKGGLHANAVVKAHEAYEHIPPELVGNRRRILISELGGKSSVLYKLQQFGIDTSGNSDEVREMLDMVKRLENQGFAFENAEASFELLVRRSKPDYRAPFTVLDYLVISEKRSASTLVAEATVKVQVGDRILHTAAEGNGPVNALDSAIRKALLEFYPKLSAIRLTDYKVRVLDNERATAASVRVNIESTDGARSWSTVGSSTNVVEASWIALLDSLEYPLLKWPAEYTSTEPVEEVAV